MYRKILVANDGSHGAAAALGVAVDLARKLAAELHMISVEELPQLPATIDEVVEDKRDANHRFATVIAAAEARARAGRVKLHPRVVVGHAVPTIVELVGREGFDLLVVGFMGHSAIYSRLIGGTTDRLVELAPCAVLVVK